MTSSPRASVQPRGTCQLGRSGVTPGVFGVLPCPVLCSALLSWPHAFPACPILPSLLSSLPFLSLLPRLLSLFRVWDAWVSCCVRERTVTMLLLGASIASDHKLGGLKQRAFILLQLWRSDVWRQFPGLELRSLIWGQCSLWRPCLLWVLAFHSLHSLAQEPFPSKSVRLEHPRVSLCWGYDSVFSLLSQLPLCLSLDNPDHI